MNQESQMRLRIAEAVGKGRAWVSMRNAAQISDTQCVDALVEVLDAIADAMRPEVR